MAVPFKAVLKLLKVFKQILQIDSKVAAADAFKIILDKDGVACSIPDAPLAAVKEIGVPVFSFDPFLGKSTSWYSKIKQSYNIRGRRSLPLLPFSQRTYRYVILFRKCLLR